MASIKELAASLSDKREAKAVREMLDAVLADNTNLRDTVVALNAKLDALGAKLNADAGVTDVNYPTDFSATLNPAPLSLAD